MKKRKTSQSYWHTGSPDAVTVNLCSDMILSPAWQSLTQAAQTVYLVMRIAAYDKVDRPDRESVYANFSLLTKHYGLKISRRTLYSSTKLLKDVGFIDSLTTVKDRQFERARYRFSDRWQKYGTPDFKTQEETEAQKVRTEEAMASAGIIKFRREA